MPPCPRGDPVLDSLLPGACPASSFCPRGCKSGLGHITQLKFTVVLVEERGNPAGMGMDEDGDGALDENED